MKENIQKIKSEICDVSEKMDCIKKSGKIIMSKNNKEEERDIIKRKVRSLKENIEKVR